MRTKSQPLPIELITVIQMRAGTKHETIEDYAEMFKADPSSWPFRSQCKVYRDGDQYYLWDGVHRFHAAKMVSRSSIMCDVEVGTMEDAEDKALAANQTHGLRRSREDVRNAIEVALRMERWAKLSNRVIADHIGTSHMTVKRVRDELESTGTIIQLNETEGKDGKKRKLKKPKPRPNPEAESPEVDETPERDPQPRPTTTDHAATKAKPDLGLPRLPKTSDEDETLEVPIAVQLASLLSDLKALLPKLDKSEAEMIVACVESAHPTAKPKTSVVVGETVRSVVDHYKTYRPRVNPGEKETKFIKARIKEGYSLEDLKLAIDGNYKDPHCCGDNDRGTQYHDLNLIFRDSDHVARFIEVAEKPELPKLKGLPDNYYGEVVL